PYTRPLLDVMYFYVNGHEGINRWHEDKRSLPDFGAVYLNGRRLQPTNAAAQEDEATRDRQDPQEKPVD
ncbi:hypothetical protein HF878_09965, partial [Selenomonas bovis]